MRVDDATQERQLVVGQETGSWWLDPREELVAGEQRGKQQKAVAVGDHGGQLRLDKREANREVGVDPRRGSQHQTPEQRGEETR